MLEENYNHLNIEDKIYNFWESNKLFEPKKNKKKKYFSIVIPPPNVTGNLHMGHALNNSIQDLLVRFYRLKGYETLWQPGTDHAGIATELVVEKKLNEKNQSKNILGREKFLQEVWNWKEHSGNLIINQLKKLGSSCDWSQTRFTMDKNMSEAVVKVFLELHKKKLIYKDFKLSNWDPVLKTAISDLEVVQKEIDGKLYYIKYFIDKNDFISIATTRPETIFADTAIAVNPKDKRYKKFISKKAKIPIIDKQIKIIADDYADPDQGSGAVKITPAHDFNDYEVGLRHDLEKINILEADGRLNKNCPKKYQGLDRFEARKLIIDDLKLKKISKVMFISAERFMYQFVKSIKSNDMVKFKDYFRNTDVLLIDDIQFISGKEAMQEEFFHTFNALLDKDSQIIVSADRAPNKLSRIQDRIKSRFSGGLVVDIQSPDYDLRKKIVESKAEDLNSLNSDQLKISKEIQDFISNEIKASIRELVGAINRITSFSRIYNKVPNLAETKVILKDLLNLGENRVTIDLIQTLVCKYFKISKNEMLSSRRSRYLVRPRQIAIYLTKILTSKSLPEIGREFSNRDHTTIIHSVKTIEKLKENNLDMVDSINNLKNQILYSNKENEI